MKNPRIFCLGGQYCFDVFLYGCYFCKIEKSIGNTGKRTVITGKRTGLYSLVESLIHNSVGRIFDNEYG